ncbi:relaxase/mobilization nuclease domain-containing protein [Kordiimonas pumila]|uniref:Relaxase/mobilization nuclease domain-containing protein n=1 Tax=Kordiimonas pumila TaxID=2161677 RepID=A0ABV7D6L2_9PROT
MHYNLYGNKAEPNPHKCAWHVSKNMFTSDLDAAGNIMEATASNSKTPKPSYHFSIDWDRSEERFLNQEKCIEAADKVLEKIGLSEHQALYFWHVDANHPHMHVVVNRVHEHTGIAWDVWKSKERLERATHEVAKEMDFLQVPGKHNEMDYTPDKERTANSSRSERATSEQLKPWAKEKIPDIKAEIGNAFYHAESWQELTSTLSDAGYELRTKGQGYIITDGSNYTQLSKMGKQVRMDKLEEKFGEKFAQQQNHNPLALVHEHSPHSNLDEIPDRIETELKDKVDRWERQERLQTGNDRPSTTDRRVIELSALLDSIERFDNGWNEKKSAAAMMTATKKVKQQQNYLERAEDLLKHHQQAAYDLIFASYKKPEPDKGLNTTEKINDALKDMNKRRHKTPKMERLIKVLKWRKQKIQAAHRKAKRHKEQMAKKMKAKNKEKLERKMFYRMQKMAEAKSRVTTRELEVSAAHAKMRRSVQAHDHNIATRKHLKECRNNLVKNIPKEAIMNADVSWKEKKRLFAAWYAEQDLKKAKERDNKYERDIVERDPYDD